MLSWFRMQLKNKFVQETITLGLNLGPRRKIREIFFISKSGD
jgi:hypothetical protein